MIPQLCHIGIKAGLTNSQNMLFRYESVNLDIAYLNHEPLLSQLRPMQCETQDYSSSQKYQKQRLVTSCFNKLFYNNLWPLKHDLFDTLPVGACQTKIVFIKTNHPKNIQ